jgi:hypothetical protein
MPPPLVSLFVEKPELHEGQHAQFPLGSKIDRRNLVAVGDHSNRRGQAVGGVRVLAAWTAQGSRGRARLGIRPFTPSPWAGTDEQNIAARHLSFVSLRHLQRSMASSAPVRESRSGAKTEHVDLTKPPAATA